MILSVWQEMSNFARIFDRKNIMARDLLKTI